MKRTPVLYRVVLSVLVLNMSNACTPQDEAKQDTSTRKTPSTHKTRAPDITDTTQHKQTEFEQSLAPANIGRLSIPDGDTKTPLAVETMKVDVMIVGRMARTQVTQVFRNHTGRQTEGTYRFTLPDGASLSRLAMTVGETLVEGELVEREKARMIYESIVRKKKDPALLEWQGGNRFSTQVFPIEPNQTKTVVIAYEVLLPEQNGKLKYTYNLPKLDGLAKESTLGDFSFSLNSEDGLDIQTKGYSANVKQLAPGGEVRYNAKAFKPGGPIEVSFGLDRTRGIKQSYATKNKTRYFLTDIVPRLPKANATKHQNIVLALDTSAGLGQPVLDRAATIAKGLIEKAPEDAKIQVVTGDFKTRVCGTAPVEKASALACLSNLNAGGATNLQQLLLTAASEAKKLGDNTNVVFFTDGVASIGEMDAEMIEARTQKAMANGVALHTVAIGHSANESGLRKLSRAINGQSIRLAPNERPSTALARISSVISEPLLVGVTATVKGGALVDITPNTPQNLARGEALALMGTFDDNKDAVLELSGTYRGQPWTQRIELQHKGGANNALLPRFWARRQIDVLKKQDAPRADIVKLSKAMGVLSPFTSFLVLESDAAFKKYQIKRKQEEAARLAKNKLKQDTTGTPENLEQKNDEPATIKNLEKGKGTLQQLLKEKEKAIKRRTILGMIGSKGRKGGIPQVDGKMVDEFDVKNIEVNRALNSKQLGTGALKNIFKDNESFDSKMNIAMSGKRLGGEEGEFRSTRRRMKKLAPRARFNEQQAKRIKTLEQKKQTLKRAERAELLELYVLSNQKEKARAWFNVLKTRIPQDKRPQGQLELLRTYATQKFFLDDFAVALKARLKQPDTPTRTIRQFTRHCMMVRNDSLVLKTFKTAKLSPIQATTVLDQLRTYQRGPVVKTLFNTWKNHYTSKEQLLIVNQFPRLLDSYHFDLLKDVAHGKDATRSDILQYINMAFDLKKGASTTELTLRACTQGTLNTHTCGELLKRYTTSGINNEDIKTLQGKMKTLFKQELQRTLQARAEDMANRALILRAVSLYDKQGNQDAAERLLSELVEFTPHEYTQRLAFGHNLVRRGQIVQGCDQYATAVQLNPARRDTFRTMMSLRKQHPKHAKAVRECIVNGVSRLPVKRAVSIILTWDTPSNDVDLHIHEPNKEHVSYQHTASKNGGLLYYDITNGYGPEIYVLGSGPIGTYPVSLVYYGGAQRNVKATVTILRDAGSPEESRKDITVVLPKSNSSKEYRVGQFILTERDKSGDTRRGSSS